MSAMVHAGMGTGESSPGRIATGGLDTTHGTVLYLDDISVAVSAVSLRPRTFRVSTM